MTDLDRSRPYGVIRGIAGPDEDSRARYLQDGVRFDVNGHALAVPQEATETPVEAPETDPDTVSRIDEIVAAIELLDPDNPDHFTTTGKPKVDAIESVLGYDITAQERDEAMSQ